THILVSFVYKAAFNYYSFSYAAALSLVIFLLLFVFSMVFMRQSKATEPAY
ncbi:MAG TPA: sugar ABC transporter permease, partial [Bacteroidetes bacterium]|nr:sugar ABC transporter permease [Bacteroidota bacterium]